MIACRRYGRSTNALSFLMDAVRRELFSTISMLPLSIQSINALILVSTWVFPDVRFLNDPTSIFSGVIMNAALLLGIHTGKGSNPEYSIGMFQNNFSDEEAQYTWAGYCITSQRFIYVHAITDAITDGGTGWPNTEAYPRSAVSSTRQFRMSSTEAHHSRFPVVFAYSWNAKNLQTELARQWQLAWTRLEVFLHM